MGNKRLFPEKSADQLLKEFVQTGAEAPFEEIVRRYAGMVYSVCYRVANNSHDAEDATQAVFLSLALQAKTGKPIHYIGPWLQRVAHRLALDVKKSKTRRKKREEKLAEMNGNGQLHRVADPSSAPYDQELKRIMQEELNAMPAKYRMPLILHYFGGMNREEMAKELNCKPATLGVRVHRGRAMLGKRLAKRGMAIGASLPFFLERVLHSSVPSNLVHRTASHAIHVAAHTNGNGAAAAYAATHAIAIARIAAKAVMYAKVRAAIAIMLVVSLATALAGPTVVQSVKEMRLRFQMPFDLRNLIRPLFRAFTPSPQANNQQPAVQPTVAQSTPAPAIHTQPEISLPSIAPVQPKLVAVKPTDNQQTLSIDPAPANTPAANQPDQPLASRDAIQSVGDWISSMPANSGAHAPIGSQLDAPTSVPSSDESSPSTASTPNDPPIDVSTGRLTLGGGGGSVEQYIMPANANITTKGTIIGDASNSLGYFHQSGGSHNVHGDLVLGKQKGSTGIYEQTGGSLNAAAEIIGDQGTGIFHQTGGTNTSDHVALGNAESGTGTYTLEGDGVLDGGDLTVGVKGKGTFSQNGGSVVLNSYTFGPYASDYFPANQTMPATINVAQYASANGTFALKSGSVFFSSGQKDPTVRIGDGGNGAWQIGDSKTTANISEGSLVNTNLVVRANAGASGTLSGWGNLKFTGTLVNNDSIIADGFGVDHTLDLSHFSAVENNIENPTDNGRHGWIAQNKGALKLPPIPVRTGTNTYTWGESDIDPILDLVNSVRFTANTVVAPGDIEITLDAINRDDIPKLPSLHHFIGVWKFDAGTVDATGGYDFTIRYDDVLAKSEGINESILKFWAYEPDGIWHRIKDDTFHRDIEDNLIGAHAPGDLLYFAVSAPEPSAALLMLTSAATLMLRRRRRRSR